VLRGRRPPLNRSERWVDREMSHPAGPQREHGRQLRLVQYLRGAAAIMVAVYHASHYLAAARGGTILPGLQLLGLYGVSIFFAISGSLMAMLVRRTDPWTFLAHRVVRIYPALLIAIALYFVTYRLLGLPAGFDPVAATLVPAGPRFYPLGIEWTLLYEVTFYVALFLLALARGTDRLEAVALAWLAVIVARLVVVGDWQEEATPPIHRLLFMGVCTGFAAGLLIPSALRLGLVPRWTWAAGAALMLVSTALEVGTHPWWVGLASALLVAGAMRVDEPNRASGFDPLKALGDASYGIYLIHVPVLRLAFELSPSDVPTPVLWAAGLLAALAAGMMIGFVDVRLYRWSKAIVDRARMVPLRTCMSLYLAAFGLVACYGIADTGAKERRSAQERAIVARLPPGSLRDRETAKAAVASAGLSRGSVRGEVEEVRAAAGLLLLLGRVVVENNAGHDVSVLVFHRGAQVGVARARTRGAATRGSAPALAGIELAFRVGVLGVRCADAGELGVLALDLTGGTATVLDGPVVVPKC
jgi:exopolysaccharide production protein ExoZ